MTLLRFVVPGDPVSQLGMRIATRGRGGVPLPFALKYANKKTANYMVTVAQYAQVAMIGRDLIEGPIALDLFCIFELPKSRHRKREPVGRAWRDTKPDFDNLAKPVGDALKTIVYTEDSHIVDGRVRTIWGAQGEEGRAIVTLSLPGPVPQP